MRSPAEEQPAASSLLRVLQEYLKLYRSQQQLLFCLRMALLAELAQGAMVVVVVVVVNADLPHAARVNEGKTHGQREEAATRSVTGSMHRLPE